jgi:predicted dehydrogenase
MRLGIIGCGQIVESAHVGALRACREMEVAAVADLSPRRGRRVADALAARRRPRVYRDHRAMLAHEDLAVVLVATPPGVRREHVLDVLASGTSVLCEKPIATTLADADAIVAASDERGVRCLMAHNYASFDEHARVCRLLREGAIGRLHTAIFEGLGSHPWDGAAEFSPGWRYRPELAGGGRLMDAGIHAIYLAEAYFGERPSRVSAEVSFGPAGPPTDVRCFARFGFEDALALLHIGEGHGGSRVEVIGTEGRIELRYADGARFFDASPRELRLYRDGELVTSEPVPTRHTHVTARLYEHVLTRLADPPAYAHSARHGRDLLATALAAYLSARTGRRVELDERLPAGLRERGALALWPRARAGCRRTA